MTFDQKQAQCKHCTEGDTHFCIGRDHVQSIQISLVVICQKEMLKRAARIFQQYYVMAMLQSKTDLGWIVLNMN